ncbi:hypothetical protein [Spiroplasma taiwanense]|uniref:Transmembrane protein n=1 Tax=Spiroplasma taiwanense CT-1 TaxID=1276220 RepID=S5MGG7_9MOLU|nr:hypothetical protein [Spiroplasma taiwanense]AGR40950.1 transmembrane protein [Spiroplasma taiwanense CT-1]
MESLTKILLIALILAFLTLLTIKILNTLFCSKVEIREIQSADSNISSSKIEEIIKKFQHYLKIDDLKVNYADTDTYIRITDILRKRNKEINIPKWIMPSVGYELDYILANIWYSAKLYQKNKQVKKAQLFIKWLPLIFSNLFYLNFLISIFLSILYISFFTSTYPGEFLLFLFRIPIFEVFGLVSFLILITIIFFLNNIKSHLELKYEREIISFVNNECAGYKSDISAARVYATGFEKLIFKIFRWNSKTSNLKFLGPFTIL